MLIELASHNPDILRLVERGYAVRIDGCYLVVRDIPYLDDQGNLQTGAIVAILKPLDKHRFMQDDHQVYFAGSVPYGLNGRPIPNLAGGSAILPLSKNDVVVQRSFSNKPKAELGRPDGFPDFFEKIEHYTNIIAGPAIDRFGATPYTFRVDNDVASDSVFKYHDSLTVRAEIGDLVTVFKEEIVAIIGLGGTGSYLLDFLAKTHVKEIRAFDGDRYHIHNAFRSPGEVNDVDWDKPKAEVYKRRYDNFRHGVNIFPKYVDISSVDDFAGVTFAFVCVDKGTARKEIFDLLIALKIPFIDVGLGLNRKQGSLAGTIRCTYYSAEDGDIIRAKQLAEEADHPDDEYRRNVQIAELNALNAGLAVLRFKQLRGFYFDDSHAYHMLFRFESMKLLCDGPHQD